MPPSVAVADLRPARVRYARDCVVRVVGVGGCPLLGCRAVPQTPVPVVVEGARLPLLIDLCDLVARVVSVGGGRVGSRPVPVLFHPLETTQIVTSVALL